LEKPHIICASKGTEIFEGAFKMKRLQPLCFLTLMTDFSQKNLKIAKNI